MNLLRLLVVISIGWLLGNWLKAQLNKRASAKAQLGTELVKCAKCQVYYTKGTAHICQSIAALWLLAFLLLAPATAWADAGGRYLLEVTGTNLTASLEVNGIKAERWGFSREGSAGASLNHWLRPGNNSLSFKAVPLGRGAPRITARIYFMGVGRAGVSNTVNLLEVTDFAKAQHGITVSFNLSSAPGMALWQTSTAPNALTPAEAASLVNNLRAELVSAMASGGGIEDVAALKTERDDMLRAFASTATPQPLALAPQSPQAGIEVSPSLAAGDLALEPVPGTVLLRLARKDNSPLLALRQNGQVTAVPALIVGWSSNMWHILRRAH